MTMFLKDPPQFDSTLKSTIRALVYSGIAFEEFWERNSDPEFFGKTKEYVWFVWLHEEIDKAFEDVEDLKTRYDTKEVKK